MGGVWGQAQDSNAMAISIFKKVPGEMGRVTINYEESLVAICNTLCLCIKDSFNPLLANYI